MKAKGFTLIELVAAMAMVSIIMLAINGVFASGVYSYIDGQRKEKAVNSNKIAMALLSTEIKNSKMFTLNTSGYIIKDSHGATITLRDMSNVLDTNPLIPIAYIQGNANSRYMYVLEQKVGTQIVVDHENNANSSKDCFELHKYTFTEQPMKTYIPADTAGNPSNTLLTLQLTKTESDAYTVSTNSQNVFLAGSAPIDSSAFSALSSYVINSFVFAFEPLGQNSYLLAKKKTPSDPSDPYYKIKMVEVLDKNFTLVSNIKVCDDIESIKLENLGYECKINIKTLAKYHEEETNTSTTILNYRGVS